MFGSKQLCIVANENFLIRGPETNPFMHDRDWIVFSPAISVPLSVVDWKDTDSPWAR